MSITNRQRGLNLQPSGGRNSDGGVPGIGVSSVSSPDNVGSESISPQVYGWCGS